MADEAKRKRKTWSREETLGFLQCYKSRMDEFLHSRKKKYAYRNVLEDMIAMGMTTSLTTTAALESKMRTLMMAYKTAKDNSKRTGASPCFVPYMDEMEEIFGQRPIISNTHTIHVGMGSSPTPSSTSTPTTPSLTATFSPSPSSTPPPTSPSLAAPFSTSPSSTPSPTTPSLTAAPLSPSPSSTLPPLPLSSTRSLSPSPALPQCSRATATAITRKRKSAREVFFDKQLKLKKEEAEANKALKENFMKDTLEALEKKWEKEVELEREKIRLLKKIAGE